MSSIKVEYEWCLELLMGNSQEGYEIMEPLHSDLKPDHDGDGGIVPLLASQDEGPYLFSLKRWEITEWDQDFDYNYLGSDGTFRYPIPKYVQKIIDRYIDQIISHDNFNGN